MKKDFSKICHPFHAVWHLCVLQVLGVCGADAVGFLYGSCESLVFMSGVSAQFLT